VEAVENFKNDAVLYPLTTPLGIFPVDSWL